MAEKGHTLSKSTFIRGVQCLKSLYLNKHRPFLRDRLAPEQLAKFRRGHEVGKLAWQLFPGGINCAPGHPSQYTAALEKTRKLIAEETPVIYEAAFSHQSVLILLDILVKNEQGWHAYEVKSSVSVSETYITDAALQYHVITGTGLNLQSFNIIHLNPDFIRDGIPDVHKLFSIQEVTDQLRGLESFITAQIEKSRETLSLKHSPSIPTGQHCYKPYPCDFIGHCWKKTDKDSVYTLTGISFETRARLAAAGYLTIPDIPAGLLEENDAAILSSHLSGKDITDKAGIRKMVDGTGTPVFIAFLTVRPAVPVVDGFRPFGPMIVGLNWIDVQGNEGSLIVDPGETPDYQIRKKLRELASVNGMIVHAGGKWVSEALSQHYPDLTEKFIFTDLEEIFLSGYFYRPGLVPDAGISNIAAFLNLTSPDQTKISQVMAGVKYMEAKEGNREQTLIELGAALSAEADSCRSVYYFLKSIINNET